MKCKNKIRRRICQDLCMCMRVSDGQCVCASTSALMLIYCVSYRRVWHVKLYPQDGN